MSARRLAALLLAVVAAGFGAQRSGLLERAGDDENDGPPARTSTGRVVKVIDGDTIHVQLGATREKVRYIGVDTPETKHPTKGVQCFGERASRFNAQLVGGERARLVRDVEERDRYGRLLAYVYRARDGLFVNAELARQGFATVLTIAPDVRHAGDFVAAARDAREHGRGLWSAC